MSKYVYYPTTPFPPSQIRATATHPYLMIHAPPSPPTYLHARCCGSGGTACPCKYPADVHHVRPEHGHPAGQIRATTTYQVRSELQPTTMLDWSYSHPPGQIRATATHRQHTATQVRLQHAAKGDRNRGERVNMGHPIQPQTLSMGRPFYPSPLRPLKPCSHDAPGEAAPAHRGVAPQRPGHTTLGPKPQPSKTSKALQP